MPQVASGRLNGPVEAQVVRLIMRHVQLVHQAYPRAFAGGRCWHHGDSETSAECQPEVVCCWHPNNRQEVVDAC